MLATHVFLEFVHFLCDDAVRTVGLERLIHAVLQVGLEIIFEPEGEDEAGKKTQEGDCQDGEELQKIKSTR